MSFTPDEIKAMKETVKALEWWAKIGWQYTTTNCEANKMSMADMFFSIQSGGETSKNITCRYQISLHRALSKFEIFYERMLYDNETQAKYIEEKYGRLREYAKDTNNPDRRAPWIARECAYNLANSLRNIADNSAEKTKYTKAPPKIAVRAYLILKATGCFQTEAAEIMTKELKPKKPYQQYQISRFKIQCEKWLKENNLDIFPPDIATPQIAIVDPAKLNMGARTDGKITGDPRHKKAKYDDYDGYDD